MLHLDVGIDIGGSMKTIMNKGQKLPYEYEIKLSPMIEQKELEISFYEGQRALVKHNQLLGKIMLTNDENIGLFELHIKIDNDLIMSAIIENNILGTFKCANESVAFFILKESDTFIESDKLIKECEVERQKFKEYIYQTLHTLNNVNDDKTQILNLLYKAEDASYAEDVTIDELQLMQTHIEDYVNSFMKSVISRKGCLL
jgi:molecular chaperone DnaK (HSP70)